jgi:hypothetical protein
MVRVAHRWGPGAAAGHAPAVAGGQGAALGWGDGVAQGFESGDLADLVEQDAADPGVAQQRLDPAAGGRAGPGRGGAGPLGRDPGLAGQGGRVPADRHQDQLLLHRLQMRQRDRADQPGQHRGARLGQHPVQDRLRHQRQVENDKPIWPHCAGLIWPHLRGLCAV